MEWYHKSVFLKEAIDALNIKKEYWYLDCTLGDGGHSLEILKRGGNVVGIDVDPQGIERARSRLKEFEEQNRFIVLQGNFRDIDILIQPVSPQGGRGEQTDNADQKFAGAIFDLGVSSLQLETPSRGFSFGKMGPLDMRMDPNLAVTALDLVNHLSRKELYELFKSLGEEKYSKKLADSLERARGVGFSSTTEFADFIQKVVGKREKIHPATRVFQALRMVVNDELGALKEGLEKVKEFVKNDGRIVVISFHSLEDRIVKNTFREWEYSGFGEVLTKKPLVPGEEEVSANPRSRSAKMRVFKTI